MQLRQFLLVCCFLSNHFISFASELELERGLHSFPLTVVADNSWLKNITDILSVKQVDRHSYNTIDTDKVIQQSLGHTYGRGFFSSLIHIFTKKDGNDSFRTFKLNTLKSLGWLKNEEKTVSHECITEAFSHGMNSSAIADGWQPNLQEISQAVMARQMFLLCDQELLNWQDEEGKSMLMYAIEYKNTEYAKNLLYNRCININLQCDNGRSPFSYAIEAKNRDLIGSILERFYVDPFFVFWAIKEISVHDNDLSKKDKNTKSAILELLLDHVHATTTKEERGSVLKMLGWITDTHESVSTELLVRACSQGINKNAMENGWKPNFGDIMGCRLAYRMILMNDEDVFNWQDAEGKTLLMHAILQNHDERIEHLLHNEDLNIDIQCSQRYSAFMYAAMTENRALVSHILELYNFDQEHLFLALKAAVENPAYRLNYVSNDTEKSALKILDDLIDAENNQAYVEWKTQFEDVVECSFAYPMVLMSDEDILNWRDSEGKTLFMHAILQNNNEKIGYLLQNRAFDVDVECNNGYSALMYAAMTDNGTLVNSLLEMYDFSQESLFLALKAAVENPEYRLNYDAEKSALKILDDLIDVENNHAYNEWYSTILTARSENV